ncbi:MAG TPA: hypothetical protein ENK18_06010 [Deltaproteobacteria bacterium]|nr:hypothetical protein [Deltaproteobacteria bacterium]
MGSPGSFEISIFDDRHRSDRAALQALLQGARGLRIEDHLTAQLQQLALTAQLQQLALDGQLPSGRWVYYPWRNALVRVLAPEGLARLRTRWWRGPGPVQRLEHLQRAHVLALGLSPGGDELLSLVCRGIGGSLSLANPDHLCLSRDGRIQASTCDLGESRAVSVARRIRELDPYVQVEVHLEGDAPEELGALVARADLVLGTCDDPQIAYLARIAARRARVPVVMRREGRAVIEIDRFDLDDPRSPLGPDARAEEARAEEARIAPGRAALVQQILLGQPCPSGRYRIVAGQGARRPVRWLGVGT